MGPTQAQAVNDSLDLALAAELQAALLPKECPLDCDHLVAAARNRMCGSVGGDFYDFIRVNADQAVMFVGDVVGHGVSASLVMAQLMGYLRSKPAGLARPGEIIRDLNRMLIDLGDRIGNVLPVSLLYAIIDAPTGISFFINAGHPRPFLYDRDKRISLHLGPRNLVLGVEEFEPVEGCHTFTAGQRMVLFTDGLLDATDPRGNRFGEAGLREVLSQRIDDDPRECADAVFLAVDLFRGGETQVDDETIIVMDRA